MVKKILSILTLSAFIVAPAAARARGVGGRSRAPGWRWERRSATILL